MKISAKRKLVNSSIVFVATNLCIFFMAEELFIFIVLLINVSFSFLKSKSHELENFSCTFSWNCWQTFYKSLFYIVENYFISKLRGAMTIKHIKIHYKIHNLLKRHFYKIYSYELTPEVHKKIILNCKNCYNDIFIKFIFMNLLLKFIKKLLHLGTEEKKITFVR